MTYYYCTCSTEKSKKRAEVAGRTPFREVIAKKDGTCYDCGYYAVAYFEEVDPNRIKLYDKLFNCGAEPESLRTIGGLSIKNNKRVNARRKNKDGDMDI